jgi:cysteine desulfurase
VPPERSGVVDAARVIAAMRDDTRLVAMMLVNNETGVVQPVAEIGQACRERGIAFHVDAVQAAGKIPVDVNAIACDSLAISAHKMHAPKGIGALYVRRGYTMSAHIVGGAQERRRRAGTENVPLAAAFATAVTLPSASTQIAALRDRFEAQVRAAFEVVINGDDVARLPNTSNVTFRGVDGEGLVIALDLSGIATSTGSACSSGRVEPSPVLLAMGLSPQDAKATVRFSLSRFTTEEEIARVVQVLGEVVPRCRG